MYVYANPRIKHQNTGDETTLEWRKLDTLTSSAALGYHVSIFRLQGKVELVFSNILYIVIICNLNTHPPILGSCNLATASGNSLWISMGP